MNDAQVWDGADALASRLVPVREIVTHPRNPRRGKVDLIAESLERFGQVRPILVNGNRIIARNHTYLAAVKLGWTHVAIVRLQFDDDAEAVAYLLADNRLAELGQYDPAQEIELLEELEASGRWDGTGYDPDALEDLRAAHGAVLTTELEEFRGAHAATPEELAARQQHLAAGNSFRELVLTLSPDANTEFEAHMKVLRKEYGGAIGYTDAIVRAAASQAALA